MTTANTFYTPVQVAKTLVAMATEDSYLSALVNRDYEDDLLGGGGRGRTVNIKIPGALIARDRGIDDTTAQIVLDELTESTIPLTLANHKYSAIPLSEGDLTLNLTDFAKQVLQPQVSAIVDAVEWDVVQAIEALPGLQTGLGTKGQEGYIPDEVAGFPTYDPADPIPTLTAIRRILRNRGVAPAGLQLTVGTEVYAHLLDAKVIVQVNESGSTAALREGNVGQVRGFTVVESNRLDENDIVAFHRDAITLAVRAPLVPAGVAFGATEASGGYNLRYIRDYDALHTVDRSVVSTFSGVQAMPLKRIVRDYTAGTVSVLDVPGGAGVRINVGA